MRQETGSALKDRFTRGFVAGVLAGIPVAVLNVGSFELGLATLRWSDFMSIMLYGHLPATQAETVVAIMMTFGLVGFLGTVFALILPGLTSRNYVFKAMVYAAAIWFTAYVVTHLFKIPELRSIPLATVLSNFIGALAWGLLLALALKWLDSRVRA